MKNGGGVNKKGVQSNDNSNIEEPLPTTSITHKRTLNQFALVIVVQAGLEHSRSRSMPLATLRGGAQLVDAVPHKLVLEPHDADAVDAALHSIQ